MPWKPISFIKVADTHKNTLSIPPLSALAVQFSQPQLHTHSNFNLPPTFASRRKTNFVKIPQTLTINLL